MNIDTHLTSDVHIYNVVDPVPISEVCYILPVLRDREVVAGLAVIFGNDL